jgi:hypothetical protein
VVKEAKTDSFFKRKREDCEANEQEAPRDATPQAIAEENSVQPALLLLEFG